MVADATPAMDTPRSIVTHLLARPMSLAELGAATGVSLPTLRRAVYDLVEARWLRIVGRAQATGGRPANLFGIDPTRHVLIGVHLEHPGMRLVAADLTGEVLDERVPEGVESLEPDAVHAIVLDYLASLRVRLAGRALLGLGLASPGFIDPQSGAVLTIGRVPNWNHLPLAQRLGDASGLPVTIGNDVDAMAAVEFAANGVAGTYAYVGFSEGVKFSVFLDGRPYVGRFGNAGLVDPRLLAACGDRAATPDLLTVHGLAERYLERARPAGARRVRALGEARERFLAVLDLAESGDPDAEELVGWMTEMLGTQIAAFVLLLQPELLVLGGALAGASDRLLAAIDGVARRHLPTLLDNNLVVRCARAVTPDAAALGATRVFLDRFLAADAPPLSRLGV